ncbi:hypothetical protein C8J56DRAFT_938952 [Mycena floridula]|nr:hypothetical protein C8J56DRAFT_938952 [Mycena floridula]
MAPEDPVDLSKFSLEKHQLIVIYKTALYSFYFPVAMYMCEIPTLYVGHRGWVENRPLCDGKVDFDPH